MWDTWYTVLFARPSYLNSNNITMASVVCVIQELPQKRSCWPKCMIVSHTKVYIARVVPSPIDSFHQSKFIALISSTLHMRAASLDFYTMCLHGPFLVQFSGYRHTLIYLATQAYCSREAFVDKITENGNTSYCSSCLSYPLPYLSCHATWKQHNFCNCHFESFCNL